MITECVEYGNFQLVDLLKRKPETTREKSILRMDKSSKTDLVKNENKEVIDSSDSIDVLRCRVFSSITHLWKTRSCNSIGCFASLLDEDGFPLAFFDQALNDAIGFHFSTPGKIFEKLGNFINRW